MNAKDLIKALSALPPDMEVWIAQVASGQCYIEAGAVRVNWIGSSRGRQDREIAVITETEGWRPKAP